MKSTESRLASKSQKTPCLYLPRGTTTPLEHKGEAAEAEAGLLLQKNKWVIAHPDREPLIKQGAHPGLLGENKELFY